MNTLAKIAVTALLAIPLIACGAKEEPTGVIPEGHLKALDKANNVENMLEDAQKKQQEAASEG